MKALSVSLKEVEERSKDQEQHTDETKVACKEVTSTLSSTPTPKCSEKGRQDPKRVFDQPQTSSPNQKGAHGMIPCVHADTVFGKFGKSTACTLKSHSLHVLLQFPLLLLLCSSSYLSGLVVNKLLYCAWQSAYYIDIFLAVLLLSFLLGRLVLQHSLKESYCLHLHIGYDYRSNF